MHNVKVGICQFKVEIDKQKGLTRIAKLISDLVNAGAQIVVLPEMFNCPYEQDLFSQYAEVEGQGETLQLLSDLAAKLQCYIVAGSIPEQDQDQIYNTAFVFNKAGSIIAKHRKVHLFDINIPGQIRFQESAVLTAGDQVTTFTTEYGRFGVVICYDLRFPEIFRLMVDQGVAGVFIPAAFNMTTGPAHWDTLLRARAIDNQLFVVAVSPARDNTAKYVAYGHSMVVSPWGEVIWEAGAEEASHVVVLENEQLKEARERLPVLRHRRHDLYNLSLVNKGS
ncbi:MAG TPA: carbon-nitrogen hydrolase family protein [Bacillota bacterium]|jgi:omega-amidase|nr:carbon-nitrogen hydrolase family protein [Bacillota bacterium]HOL10045.1 carbon-nitrogen hydrolase family protein [Bacillota bacterium]HPO97795.1 carbon-nitrogen hydrolase family protein [Bacillota bacterium]